MFINRLIEILAAVLIRSTFCKLIQVTQLTNLDKYNDLPLIPSHAKAMSYHHHLVTREHRKEAEWRRKEAGTQL